MFTADSRTKSELLEELSSAKAEIQTLRLTISELSGDPGTDSLSGLNDLDICRYILASSQELMSFVSTDFRYVTVNEAYTRHTGLARQEVEGRPVAEIMGESRFESVIAPRLRQCLAGETIRYSEWFDYKARGRRYMHVTYTPCKDANQAVVGIVVNARDITERHMAQEALLKSEELLGMAQRISKVGGWLREIPSGLTYWTDEHYRIFGYDPGEVTPSVEVFTSHLHEDDKGRVSAMRQAALDGECEYDVEYRFFRKGGEMRHGRTLGKIQKGPDGNPLFVFGAMQDITDRKKIEKSLKSALAEKEAMLQEIHHRVKNNLQVMLSLLDMSRSRTQGQEAEEVIDEIRTKIASMILIHNNLYRMDDLKRIDIGEFASGLAANLAEVYDAPGVALDVQAGKVLLSIETAIPVGLALNELVSNAFKYAFDDRRGEICIRITRQGDMVSVEVADNGRGISPDIDTATARTLGLKLVRDLVEIRLGGTVGFTNENGTVAAFSFCEPCAETA